MHTVQRYWKGIALTIFAGVLLIGIFGAPPADVPKHELKTYSANIQQVTNLYELSQTWLNVSVFYDSDDQFKAFEGQSDISISLVEVNYHNGARLRIWAPTYPEFQKNNLDVLREDRFIGGYDKAGDVSTLYMYAKNDDKFAWHVTFEASLDKYSDLTLDTFMEGVIFDPFQGMLVIPYLDLAIQVDRDSLP